MYCVSFKVLVIGSVLEVQHGICFVGVAYYVFPFSECLSHLQCRTKYIHLYSYTDLVTVTIYRLNKAYVYLIWPIIGDLMGFYGGLAYPF